MIYVLTKIKDMWQLTVKTAGKEHGNESIRGNLRRI